MIKVGTIFYDNYADGYCKWIVTKKLGTGVWEAEIHSDDEYAGAVAAFLTSRIQSCINYDQATGEIQNEHDNFYANLSVGSIIHVCNSGSNYTRYEVVEKDGQKYLKAIAMIGNWWKGDLPSRGIEGNIDLGYHAKQILEEELLAIPENVPHYSNVWEGNERFQSDDDPSKLPPIDLTVPEFTPEEQALSDRWNELQNQIKTLKDEADAVYCKWAEFKGEE